MLLVVLLPITEQLNVLCGMVGWDMSKNGMEILSRSGYIPSLSLTDFDLCEYCVYGKHANPAYKRNLQKRVCVQLALAHSDLFQMPTRSMGVAEYFITFIDHASRKV